MARSAKRDAIPRSVAAWDARKSTEPTKRRAFSEGVNDRANDGTRQFGSSPQRKPRAGTDADFLRRPMRAASRHHSSPPQRRPKSRKNRRAGKGTGKSTGKSKGKGKAGTDQSGSQDEGAFAVHHRTEQEAEADERRILERQRREDAEAEAAEAAEYAKALAEDAAAGGVRERRGSNNNLAGDE